MPLLAAPQASAAPAVGRNEIWFRNAARLRLAPQVVYAFETRRRGESRTSPPRTVGLAALVAAERKTPGAKEAAELTLRYQQEPAPAEAAKEKVAYASFQGDTQIYQADRQNRTASLCACGNATAAATALLASTLKRLRLRQNLRIPEGEVEVISQVAGDRQSGWDVEQSWRGIRFHAQSTNLLGREVAVCTGTFNDYLVVRLDSRAELEAFRLEEVLGLWQGAKQFSGFDDPLRARLVAVAPDQAQPFARFFTCGRTHPGAPLTGLATLAMAARHIDWLAALFTSGRVAHRRGVDVLPDMRSTRTGTEIMFPAIHVLLREAQAANIMLNRFSREN